MHEQLVSILRKIDLPTLQRLVGTTILKAIRLAGTPEDESAIADTLALKYQTLALSNRDLRIAIINSLSPTDAVQLVERVGVNDIDDFRAYGSLEGFFASYNTSKSKILADFLGLGEDYYSIESKDERCSEELITVRYREDLKAVPYLHPYQKRVKDEIMIRLNQKSEKSFFVQMPTGAGKTYTALECVVDLLRRPPTIDERFRPSRNKFVVWLVDQNELAEQALDSFIRLWKLRGEHEVKAFRLFHHFEPDLEQENGGVVFAGFDKFYSALNNPAHRAHNSITNLISNSQLLVIDEAHHSLAATYFACINRFRETPFIKILGLSATPGTADTSTTAELVSLYSSDKISIRDEDWTPVSDAVSYLQNKKYLARLRTKLLETGITSTENDTGRILDELASNAERNSKILDQIKLANDNGEATLVFACTLDHVYALLILCRANGIEARHIVGDVEQSDRIGILEGFRRGEYNILINLDILSTGIDLPNVNKIILARPINSPNLVSQILGRALRGPKNGGNEENIIVNVKDNLLRFPGTSFLYNYYQGDWETL